MALGAQPQNSLHTIQTLARLSDDIWYYSGDKSTDLSYYTKRAILTGIYVSTGLYSFVETVHSIEKLVELHMLTDRSDHYRDTWQVA